MSKLTFGKYDGESMLAVALVDPEYVMWAYENTPSKVSPAAYAVAVRHIESEQREQRTWDMLAEAGFEDAGDRW